MDYTCIGDVLAFDTTYRTNAYWKPLVILVDINHHHQTILFGCALLVNEIVSSYTRVLETFLDVMNNKKPLFVIINGDKTMCKAIRGYFQTLIFDYVFSIFSTMHSLMSVSNTLLKNLNVHKVTYWKCLIFMDSIMDHPMVS